MGAPRSKRLPQLASVCIDVPHTVPVSLGVSGLGRKYPGQGIQGRILQLFPHVPIRLRLPDWRRNGLAIGLRLRFAQSVPGLSYLDGRLASMYIAELVQPGTWLDTENKELDHRLGTLLDFVIRSLQDAAIALDMFETTRADTPSSDEHERRSEELWKVSAALGFSENREQLLTEWKREKWASGQTPFDYRFRRPFLMARAFVGSIDGVSKGLKAMAEELDGQDLAPPSRLLSQAWPSGFQT